MVEEINSETQVETVQKTDTLVETEKSFQQTVKSGIDTLTEVVQSIAESQLASTEAITGLANRVKALETPTDLPLSPKGTVAGDDVGAKVTVPDTYQSNSVQAGLDDDRSGDKKPASDKGGLKMQQKSEHTFTTETPRPNAALETVDKSIQRDSSQILQDARAGGYEGLSNVAKGILSGKYYTPSPDEVGVY
jgi:prophage DNA circulation protein